MFLAVIKRHIHGREISCQAAGGMIMGPEVLWSELLILWLSLTLSTLVVYLTLHTILGESVFWLEERVLLGRGCWRAQRRAR